MSLLDLYNKASAANAAHVADAKKIPSNPVHFFDLQGEIQPNQFKVNMKQGDPTTFSQQALQHYNDELKGIKTPDSFKPLDADIKLNEWSPDSPYPVNTIISET